MEIKDTVSIEYKYTGKEISTSIAMEPGAKYRSSEQEIIPDSYMISIEGANPFDKYLSFRTLDQMEEFSKHLAEYISEMRRREKE